MTGCAMPYLPYETSSSPALVCSAHEERGRQRERIERSAPRDEKQRIHHVPIPCHDTARLPPVVPASFATQSN